MGILVRRRLCATALLVTLAPPLALAETCTGLCLQQVTCPNPAVTTTVSGTVYAPNSVDPLPGVLVYVPNAPVEDLPAGATCRNGGTPPTAPLVQAITRPDGTFSVRNMPVGTNIPLVIQSGKWRRQIVISNVPSCTNTALIAAKTRFPRNQSEGDMPNFAIVTGGVDSQECILRKIGIADTEFSSPSGTGHVKLYAGAGFPGATFPTSTSETALVSSSAVLNGYDMVIFACQGAAYSPTSGAQQNLIDYANAGGRVMATHYAYTWLYNVAPFSGTATWAPETVDISADPQIAYIDQSMPDGLQLAQSLVQVGASTTQGQIMLNSLRHDFTAVTPPSKLWMSLNDPVAGIVPMQYTFDTPVGTSPEDQCGRVDFMDFHVADASSNGTTFPQECTPGMTPQEKLFEYMVFNLTNNQGVPLVLTVDDKRDFARYGNIATYTVNLANHTNKDLADGATVTITLSAGLDAASATCIGLPGSGTANCVLSGPNTFTASASIVGSSNQATWVITVPVLPASTDTTVQMDAITTGAVPATDVDTLVQFHDGFDVPNADGAQ